MLDPDLPSVRLLWAHAEQKQAELYDKAGMVFGNRVSEHNIMMCGF